MWDRGHWVDEYFRSTRGGKVLNIKVSIWQEVSVLRCQQQMSVWAPGAERTPTHQRLTHACLSIHFHEAKLVSPSWLWRLFPSVGICSASFCLWHWNFMDAADEHRARPWSKFHGSSWRAGVKSTLKLRWLLLPPPPCPETMCGALSQLPGRWRRPLTKQNNYVSLR